MGPRCPCFQSSLSWHRALLQFSFLLVLFLLLLLALVHGAADIRPDHHGLKALQRYRSNVHVDGTNRKLMKMGFLPSTTAAAVGSPSSENPKPLTEVSPSAAAAEVASSSVENVVRRGLRGAPLPPSAPSRRQNAALTSVPTNAFTSP